MGEGWNHLHQETRRLRSTCHQTAQFNKLIVSLKLKMKIRMSENQQQRQLREYTDIDDDMDYLEDSSEDP